ncbi:unnamed protein product [Psylliodes chrysocephalus]|uniref:CCHC-type domain-containing protein n=1 Tax=Psylliodes chrysocephalus TaxID=3402493 RepID=A0A9P0CSM7_9CUCU|nr:unnamed protein product [Psylliodes chrysocephala]
MRICFCFKCGKEQHAARECNNEEYCPLGDTDGHRTGTNKFEAFEKALGWARHIERQVSRQTSQMGENNSGLDNNKERQEDNNMETTEEANKETMEETEIEQNIAAFAQIMEEAQGTIKTIENLETEQSSSEQVAYFSLTSKMNTLSDSQENSSNETKENQGD